MIMIWFVPRGCTGRRAAAFLYLSYLSIYLGKWLHMVGGDNFLGPFFAM